MSTILGIFLKKVWLKYALAWLALGLFYFFWFKKNPESKQYKNLSNFANPSLWGKIAPLLDLQRAILKQKFLFFAVLFFLIALARPQWGKIEQTVRSTGLDIILVVDVSNSMEVEDVVPNRLKKAKHLIRSIVERAQGDRMGLIAFAGSALVLSPLTTDSDYILETIDTLSTSTVPLQGTDIGEAITAGVDAIERGAEDTNPNSSLVSKVMILVSDGEDNEEKISLGVKKITEAGIKLFVFGVGTENGAPIPVRDPDGRNVGYKRDRKGQSILSKFNPASLKSLAGQSNGQYWSVSSSESEIEELNQELNSLARGEFAEKTVTLKQEQFQWPLILGILFLLLELSVSNRKKRILTALFLIFLISESALARSAPTLKSYRENKEGLKSYQEDRIGDAKEHFGSAQVESPDQPEFLFNQGSVHLKEEKWDNAAQAFDRSAAEFKKLGDENSATEALFNKGIAQSLKKDYNAAADSYLRALENNAQSTRPDRKLDLTIRKNLELLFQQQQKQSKGGDNNEEKKEDGKESKDENKSGKNANDSDSKDKKEKDDQKEGDEKKNEPKKFQESNGKRQFKSEKLSKEDAKKVMAELAEKEKSLQEKMKRQKAKPRSIEKDW